MAVTIRYNNSLQRVFVAYFAESWCFKFYTLDEATMLLQPTQFSELKVDPTIFRQGSEKICNCNSVIHASVSGTVTALPTASKPIGEVYTVTNAGANYPVYQDVRLSLPDASFVLYNHSLYLNKAYGRHYETERNYSESSYQFRYTPFSDDARFETEKSYTISKTADWPSVIAYSDIPVYYTTTRRYKTKLPIQVVDSRTGSSEILSYLNFIEIGSVSFPCPSVDEVKPHLAGNAEPPDNLLTRLSTKIGPLQVNNIANVQSLRKWRELIPKVPSRKLKTLAELYLWYKYVYSTSEMDAEEMFSFFLRTPLESNKDKSKGYDHRVTLSNNIDMNTHDTFTFYFGSFDYSLLDKFGLRLNLANTWDMIPFSFVVDWFTGIGDMLSSIDAADFWTQVPLSCYTQSRKSIKKIFVKGAISDVTSTSYIRDVDVRLPSVVVTPSLNMPNGHLPEAISLILANKKK